jgi:hypothetical protein
MLFAHLWRSLSLKLGGKLANKARKKYVEALKVGCC